MWELLRNKQTGFRFKRQVPIDKYVLDFYCAETKVCVEVDGEQHQDRVAQDQIRDAFLRSIGINTIRVPSLDLFDDCHIAYDPLVKQIIDVCESRRYPQ